MGNKRNKENSNAHRGKCRKKPPTRTGSKKPPTTSKKQPIPQCPPELENSSRIINLQQLASHISDITAHAASCSKCFNSQDEAITLIGERNRQGLASILVARCNGCDMEFPFATSSKVYCLPDGSSRWESNLAAVWGQMSTGGGYSPLQENMATLGVPVMTKKAFIHTESVIGQWWWELLHESMKKAGEEERQLAIQRGDFHQGVPAITVIVDGGWSKRSHKHSYNAKSGVGIIIGQETKKILHIGVRNKYCAICAQASRKGEEAKDHKCFKNWDGASSSMETDIIVEGFKTAEEKHGVRYIRFVGDGDSSVYPSLVSSVPVWGYAIQKIECANHATKCYRSALEKLVNDNPSYKGKGKLTDAMRKRLTKAARCAIKMRSMESDKRAATQKLQHDLHNSPLHCFGIHDACSTDFCKTAQQRVREQHHNTASHDLAPTDSLSFESSTSSTTSTVSSSSHSVSSSTIASSHTTALPAEQVSDVSLDTILTVSQEQEEAWSDALDETDLEAVRSIPKSREQVNKVMLCDIQRIVGRLVSKSEQLLGKKKSRLHFVTGYMYMN